MAVEFYKHKQGDILKVFCCDSCCYVQKVKPKWPQDSEGKHWLCSVCHHFGMGSYRNVQIGDWLSLNILEEDEKC